MSSDHWDEIMGPTREDLQEILGRRSTHSIQQQQQQPQQHRPYHDDGDIPSIHSRAASHSSTHSASSVPFNSSLPDRWAKYELNSDQLREETDTANFRAVTMAAERAFHDKVQSGVQPSSTGHTLSTGGQEAPSSVSSKWKDRMRRYTIDDDEENNDEIMIATKQSDDGEDTEDEFDDEAAKLTSESDKIREQAKKMLEMAEHTHHAPYSVRRTESGGYTTMDSPYSVHRTDSGRLTATQKKHVPAALSGLNFNVSVPSDSRPISPLSRGHSPTASTTSASSAAGSGNAGASRFLTPYSDSGDSGIFSHARRTMDIARKYTTAPHAARDQLQDDIDKIINGESEDSGIDVVKSGKNSKWSSRYSIDQTLMALTGGGKSAKDVLDDFDRDHDNSQSNKRGAARDLFWGSAHQNDLLGDFANTGPAKIFGSGFSFRQKNVFGKQGVTMGQQHQPYSDRTNLQTAWVDHGLDRSGQSLPLPEPRKKTWQEQMEHKKRQRQRCILILIGLALILVSVVGTLLGKKHAQWKSLKRANAYLNVGEEVTFYVTSNSPFDSSEEQELTQDLAALTPMNGEFLVHLGNIQDSSITLCTHSRYATAKSVLLESPVPVLILPGEEDWNNCPNPIHAWHLWEEYFSVFESNFHHQFRVNHQQRRPENFGFMHKSVLFIGFHLVGGRVDDIDEWNTRLDDDIAWMESMVTLTREKFRAIVMFGNARPGPQQKVFFDRLHNFLGDSFPAIYIHANADDGGVQQYQLFDGTENIEGLQVTDGGKNPPVKVTVGFGDEPFVFT